MIVVGLTGTFGSGKSTVARHFERWGGLRIDADELAREAVRPGSPGLERIRRTFGEGVITEAGELDRDAMRRIAFDDPAARERLEQIVHPIVERLRRDRVAEAERQGTAVAVVESPLLFEKRLEKTCDAVVVVDAPREERRRRVGAERGVSTDEFARIEAAQWPAERKRQLADFLIVNEGTPAELEARARAVWEEIDALAGRLDAAGKWTMDLHMHTDHSHDCLSRPADVVRRAREVGLDRIAITDHDEITGAWEAKELDPELVIVGEEVGTAEGHDLVGLFLSRHIPPGGSFREVADEIRAQGGVVYLPHPFDAYRGATEEFLAGVEDCVDAVEGLNARLHDPRRNMRARDWARERSLPLGAGSDAHLLSEIGRARVRAPAFDGAAGFLMALRRGVIEGSVSSRWVHVGSIWARIRKRIPLPG